MGTTTTTLQINPAKLSAETGHAVSTRGIDPFLVGPKEVEIEGLTNPQTATAVTNHVFDPDFGKAANQVTLEQVLAKAQDVLAGTDTFTNNQMQKLVAALVLRVMGR